jgi:hypothetical protein
MLIAFFCHKQTTTTHMTKAKSASHPFTLLTYDAEFTEQEDTLQTMA